jgi:histidinol dehydrogenase
MQIIRWKDVSRPLRTALLCRPHQEPATPILNPTLQRPSGQSHLQTRSNLKRGVQAILAAVKQEGDPAIALFTEKFDHLKLTQFRVSEEEITQAAQSVSSEIYSALRLAMERLTTFHAAQLPRDIDLETSPGVRCERRFLPIQSVGLYVPGGTAPLPSTVMMLGVPSRLAGCPRRVLMTPPSMQGGVHPVILAAAQLLEISEIYKIGGAQAIGAMAYGTQSIRPVDKIFGPGNSWVTEAKLQVSQDAGGAAVDLPAGPSEVLIIADFTANPVFLAADLLSQAEHGPDSQVIFISNSASLIQKVFEELALQLKELPRQAIAIESLSKSVCIEVSDLSEAVEISNAYAPEHLILATENPRVLLAGIKNAGSVFLGNWSPESAGDYASGTNHVLPTYGFARAYGGLTTESFMKSMTIQELSPLGIAGLGPIVETLAEAEGLRAHRQAVSVRLKEIARYSHGLAHDLPQELEGTSILASAKLQVSVAPVVTQMIDALARPSILAMKPYQSARSIHSKGSLSSGSETQVKPRVFLDANESSDSEVTPLFGQDRLNRYPDPQPQNLAKDLAQIYQVHESQLFLARGVDEAIDSLIRVFCEPGLDQILICPPTYGMYEVSAQIQGIGVRRVPLLPVISKTGPQDFPSCEGSKFQYDFKLDSHSIIEAIGGYIDSSEDPSGALHPHQKAVKLIFLCSPNNPTGTLLDIQSIQQICVQSSGRAIVVLDEAYVEFKSPGVEDSSEQNSDYASFWLKRFPNVVVLRTLSKAWALAGARCGTAIAHPRVIELLRRVQAPYPLSAPSVSAVIEGIQASKQREMKERVKKIQQQRAEITKSLASLKVVQTIYPSEGNFILVKFTHAQAVFKAFLQAGMVVRDRSGEPGLEGCIRITIGSRAENQALLEVLRNFEAQEYHVLEFAPHLRFQGAKSADL